VNDGKAARHESRADTGRQTKAFSSDVDTGSREENATKTTRASVLIWIRTEAL
jgi:hypothetical protein